MIRRTSWHYYRHDQTDIAAQVARWMAAELGWDESRIDAEMMQYCKHREPQICG
jgi:hypothetical protein